MKKWFKKQSKLVKCILLLIPGVNWICEIILRWEDFLKTKSIFHLIIALLFSFGGMAFGYVDLIWVLLFDNLLFAD